MQKVRFALALAGSLIIPQISQAQYADTVISYNAGTGASSSYTSNPNAALGAPAAGNSVTPFAPPYSSSQLVGIGAGGEITLQMSTPIANNPADPYGINFILFANQFFDESGGVVSGLYDHNPSITVQVSTDDSTWYALNPALAPQAGTLFPTDGSGNPLSAVNPALTLGSFMGQNLADIRSLYTGSAGGTGYNLAWAQDANGNSVNLASVDYVQVDVNSGLLYLDAVSEVQTVPEPAVWAFIPIVGLLFGLFPRIAKSVRIKKWSGALAIASLCALGNARAGTLVEKFNSNPSLDGWQVFGVTNLFGWDSTGQVLNVTWDSTQPNSYFYHPLGRTVTTNDGFCVVFDLQVNDATNDNYGSELAVGLFNLAEATNPDYNRNYNESYTNLPDVFEFDYQPVANAYGVQYEPSIFATILDSQAQFYDVYDNLPLNPGVIYHVLLVHLPGTVGVSGEVFTNGQLMTALPMVNNYIPPGDDRAFQLDTLAIMNYADDGAGDDILAHGSVKNLAFASPLPVGFINTAAAGQVQFASDTNWVYTLEQSPDFQSWSPAAPVGPGNGTNLVLQATNVSAKDSFYQVRADLR